MKKSVYSLVLMDDIVEAIDQLAYAQHTSRSNLINQILAEKVALVTPEQHLQTIFDHVSEYLRPHAYFQIQNQAADHMYSIKSALRYKYNPTIRYCYYLNQHNNTFHGELKVISRTQSDVLYGYLDRFFKLWSTIENQNRKVVWQREEGAKWARALHLENFLGHDKVDELASCLSEYIRVLDQGLKIYFEQIEKGDEGIEALIRLYSHYVKEHSDRI